MLVKLLQFLVVSLTIYLISLGIKVDIRVCQLHWFYSFRKKNYIENFIELFHLTQFLHFCWLSSTRMKTIKMESTPPGVVYMLLHNKTWVDPLPGTNVCFYTLQIKILSTCWRVLCLRILCSLNICEIFWCIAGGLTLQQLKKTCNRRSSTCHSRKTWGN